MQYIIGILRNQMVFSPEDPGLENIILPENPVRFVDAFVEALSLKTLGFTIQTLKTEGSSSFDSKVFFKIYYYGDLKAACNSVPDYSFRTTASNSRSGYLESRVIWRLFY